MFSFFSRPAPHECDHSNCQAISSVLVDRVRDLESEVDRMREMVDQMQATHATQTQGLLDRLLSFVKPGWGGIPHHVMTPGAISEAVERAMASATTDAPYIGTPYAAPTPAPFPPPPSRPPYAAQITPPVRRGIRPASSMRVPGSHPISTPVTSGFAPGLAGLEAIEQELRGQMVVEEPMETEAASEVELLTDPNAPPAAVLDNQ